MTGGYADNREVGGVLTAILNCDTERSQGQTFPAYLRTAISREFSFTEREKRQHRIVGSKTRSWVKFVSRKLVKVGVP